MQTVDKLEVYYAGKHVGTMAPFRKYLTAFEYSDEWLQNGFSVSPYSLPLTAGVKTAKYDPFDGLFGIFADSLPDGWNRLLVDRMLRKVGEDPGQITQLQRLSIVGSSGMGALEYRPVYQWQSSEQIADLDRLAAECSKILHSEESDDLDTLFSMGGSSGGARPKVLLKLDGGEWIIKFPVSMEDPDAGVMEKAYMDCAERCGINVPETRLLPSKRCGGYFSVRRFDRTKEEGGAVQRCHVLTAAAILELDWRSPSLDYHTLMKLTKILCRGRREDVEQMYRRMCFNVFAHNRDDHSKNFSFLYNEKKDQWSLSPAYDLTWSSTYYGEHTTTVDGNGRNPGMKELLAVGKAAGLSAKRCRDIADEIQAEAVPLEAIYRKL